MTEYPTMFVHDGERWLNGAHIESVHDRTTGDHPSRQVGMVSGAEWTSSGTADELVRELESLAMLGIDPLPETRFPSPGRQVGD